MQMVTEAEWVKVVMELSGEMFVQQIILYRIYYKYLLLTASIIHDLLKLSNYLKLKST